MHSDPKFKHIKVHFFEYLFIAIALMCRLFLFFLPAPGRDEATYFYWSNYPEPAYALLLQALLKMFALLPIPTVYALRLPGFLSGILAVFLLDKLLKKQGAEKHTRLAIAMVFIITPWQLYVGAIVHPDNLMLCMLLAASLSAMHARWLLAFVFFGLAALAKPTGMIVLGAASLFAVFYFRNERKKAGAYIFTGALVATPSIIFQQQSIYQAMAEFGKISGEISLVQVAFITAISLFGLGGFFLPFYGLKLLRDHIKNILTRLTTPKSDDLFFYLGAGLLLTFVAAAVFRNQIKGNWLLPGFVFLLPLSQHIFKGWFYKLSAFFSLAVTLLFTISFTSPKTIGHMQSKIHFLSKTYASQAGGREQKISATASWSQRVSEYYPIDDFAGELSAFWQTHTGETTPPHWLISDDYGLAAQVAFAWNKCNTRLVLPNDGIFIRATEFAEKNLTGRILVLAVHGPVEKVWSKLPSPENVTSLNHPITATNVQIGICEILPEKGYRNSHNIIIQE